MGTNARATFRRAWRCRMKMSAALAQDIADAMTLLHPGWQVPGCRRMLLDAADLAPAGELSRAALAFAEAPGIKVPSLEVFRDPSGVWWHTGTPEHARTVRPSDQPKCATHGLFEPCRSCAADAKAATAPRPVVLVDASQAATNTAGARRAMAALGRREGEETR